MLVIVQVSFIDISKESPCGHGTVICFSIYCGAEAHFGELVNGQPADGVVQNELWVDTLVDDQKDQVNDQHSSHSHAQVPVMPRMVDWQSTSSCGVTVVACAIRKSPGTMGQHCGNRRHRINAPTYVCLANRKQIPARL